MRHIDDYLLIRHTPGGRKFPDLDCWGLVLDYYREQLGVTLPEYTDLAQSSMGRALSWELQAGRFIRLEYPEDHAVVALFSGGRLYHVGIYLSGKILHTTERRGCRYERLPAGNLADRRFYRYVPRGTREGVC